VDGDRRKQFFLPDQDGAQPNHLQECEQKRDQRLARNIPRRQVVEADRVRVREQYLSDVLDHFRHGHLFALDRHLRTLLGALQDFAENRNQVEDRNGETRLVFRLHKFADPRLRPHGILEHPLRLEHLGSILELLMLEQPVYQLDARVFQLLGRASWIGWQEHLRLDVDQRRRRENELRRNVNVQLLEHVEVIEVLLGDSSNWDVVDVDLLFADQVQK
jgi:hypothetical protein